MRYLLAITCYGVILAATLWPGSVPYADGASASAGLVKRSTADAVVNLLLFVPFGLVLGLASWPAVTVALAAGLLSTTIELAQLMIPGRFPTALDVLANTGGAWLGAIAFARRGVLKHALLQRRAGPGLLYAAFLAAVLATTAALFSVQLPDTAWYGQWTPRLGHMASYQGRVHAASIGGEPVPSRRLGSHDAIEDALERGAAIRIEMTAGPPPPSTAPIFSVFDDRQREVLMMGADGGDLLLRIRRLAADARLDEPSARIPDGLRVDAGRRVRLEVRRVEGAWCGATGAETRCVRDAGLPDAWTLLLETQGVGTATKRVAGTLALALLAWPLGFLSWSARAAAAQALALMLVLALLPRVAGLGATYLEAFPVTLLAVGIGNRARRAWLAHADRTDASVRPVAGPTWPS